MKRTFSDFTGMSPRKKLTERTDGGTAAKATASVQEKRTRSGYENERTGAGAGAGSGQVIREK